MVAVRLTPDITWSVLGAPTYFSRNGRPDTPEDLMRHECILYRFPTSGALHRWEFVRARREFAVNVPGKVITSDSLLLISLARGGIGLTYSADLVAAEDVAAGRLERVLDAFLPRRPGLFLYFPSRMQTQPKLRASLIWRSHTSKCGASKARLRRNASPGSVDGPRRTLGTRQSAVYACHLLCRFRRGSSLPPLPSRLWSRLPASPRARLSARPFALHQFEFDEAVPAFAVSVINRFDTSVMSFEVDILNGNSRFRHLQFSFWLFLE